MDWWDILEKFKPIDFKSMKIDDSGNVFIKTGDIHIHLHVPADQLSDFLEAFKQLQEMEHSPQFQKAVETEVQRRLSSMAQTLSLVSPSTGEEMVASTLVNSTIDTVKKGST